MPFKLIHSLIHPDKESSVKWSLYLRIWKEFGLPYIVLLLLGVVCTVIATTAEGYTVTLVKDVIDQGFIEKNLDSFYIIGYQLVAAYAAKGFFTYARTVFMSKAGMLGSVNLRCRLYDKMLSLSQDYFHKEQSGQIINRFTGLADAVLALVTDNIIAIVQNISSLVIMLFLMFYYAPQISGILMFLAPVILITVTIMNRKKRKVARRNFTFDAESISLINEDIIGIKTIQAFTAQKHENERMRRTENKRIHMNMKAARINGLQSPILEIFISIGLCGALLVGGHFIAEGAITTGDFTAFLIAMSAAYKPAKSLTRLNGGIQNGLIAAESLFGMLDTHSKIVDKPEACELKAGPKTVELDKVNFYYEKQDGNVLHDISLKVSPGQVCAFVGQSGGGKSTIFNLISRFYDPQEGRVLIDGQDLRDLKLASIRHSIAAVSQDVFLFNSSIADNISYGIDNVSREKIIEVAKEANAHDFIQEFPQGYDTVVGERGTLLSGGQKQRIAIARALLRDAPILLLDEATSALDSESEKLIQQALNKLMKGRTVFVIAHRLSTILDADIICVVNHGRIIERGTDSELYALNGEYHKLKDLQFKKDSENSEV